MKDKDWLRKSLHDAHISCIVRHTPIEFSRLVGKVTIPLSKEDADELYKRFNSHFYQWTGQQLRNYEV